MATRRHVHPAFLAFLAVMLILPPLTSAMADGLGIDIAHHHCASLHDGDIEHHEGAEADPYQCDQCHLAVAAMINDVLIVIKSDTRTPIALPAVVLQPVRAPPTFKPPIV